MREKSVTVKAKVCGPFDEAGLPVTVTDAAPRVAVRLAVKVNVTEQVDGVGVQLGSVRGVIVTPAGRPATVKLTATGVPVSVVAVTVMSGLVLPLTRDREAGDTDRLYVNAETVTAKVAVRDWPLLVPVTVTVKDPAAVKPVHDSAEF